MNVSLLICKEFWFVLEKRKPEFYIKERRGMFSRLAELV